MIPETLLGLILFAAAVGPGYAFVRVREQHEPPQERSALFEAAELIVIGALVTTSVAMVLLAIANATGAVDTGQLAADPGTCILTQPLRGLGALLLIFTLSPLAGHFLAWAIWHDEDASIRPGTVWVAVFGRDKKTKVAYATVELTDGRAIFGQVLNYTVDPERESRELALWKPLRQRTPDQGHGQAGWRDLPNDAVIVAATEVRTVAVQYRDAPSEPAL